VTGTASFRGDGVLIQTRLAHTFEKPLHQLEGLVGHICSDPTRRQMRLLTPHNQEMFSRFVHTSALRETRASQPMRTLEAGPYP